jgi:hypothetical protein
MVYVTHTVVPLADSSSSADSRLSQGYIIATYADETSCDKSFLDLRENAQSFTLAESGGKSSTYIPGLKVKPFDKAARNEARDFYVLYAELGPGPSLEALREGFINSWTTAGHPGKPKFKVRRVVRVEIDTTKYWIKIFTGGLGTRWTMKGIPIVDKEGKRQER